MIFISFFVFTDRKLRYSFFIFRNNPNIAVEQSYLPYLVNLRSFLSSLKIIHNKEDLEIIYVNKWQKNLLTVITLVKLQEIYKIRPELFCKNNE